MVLMIPNKNLMKKYLIENPNCERCGRFIGCEVHHKIPLSSGGTDDYSNYMTLCFECHNKIHIKNRSDLTKEGIETARRAGKQIGQKKGAKLTTKKSIEKKAEILKHSADFNGSLNDVDCMKLTGLARNTFYKYKRELREEKAMTSENW